MTFSITIWRQLDPDTAPADDASPADVLERVADVVNRRGWFCGVEDEPRGGYRAAVWAGDPPTWIAPAWGPTKTEALVYALIEALLIDAAHEMQRDEHM